MSAVKLGEVPAIVSLALYQVSVFAPVRELVYEPTELQLLRVSCVIGVEKALELSDSITMSRSGVVPDTAVTCTKA